MSERIDVKKTYKLFIAGAFVRSESGRSYQIYYPGGKKFLANPAKASRKDLRDATVAAKSAIGKWQSATEFNRSQILYRIAEILESRRSQFTEEIIAAEGVSRSAASRQVSDAIDLWVWYAGWCDKISVISGGTNPINGPFYNFTSPEGVGAVGLIAEESSSLLGLIRGLAPILAGGNTAVVIASESRPLAAITLSEVLATSDVPAGVVNILTGIKSELAPWLASHMDLDGIDISGSDNRAELRKLATENLKRIGAFDQPSDQVSPQRILSFMDQKTFWHPIGT